jgi:hypothetical protein
MGDKDSAGIKLEGEVKPRWLTANKSALWGFQSRGRVGVTRKTAAESLERESPRGPARDRAGDGAGEEIIESVEILAHDDQSVPSDARLSRFY